MQGHRLNSSRLKSAFLQRTFSNHFPIQSIPVKHFRSRIFFDLFHSPLPRPSLLSLHSRSRPSCALQLLHGPHSLHILDANFVELPHWISSANLATVWKDFDDNTCSHFESNFYTNHSIITFPNWFLCFLPLLQVRPTSLPCRGLHPVPTKTVIQQIILVLVNN